MTRLISSALWVVGVVSFLRAIAILAPLEEGNTTDPPGVLLLADLPVLPQPQLLTPIDQYYRAFSRIRLGLLDETTGRFLQKNV